MIAYLFACSKPMNTLSISICLEHELADKSESAHVILLTERSPERYLLEGSPHHRSLAKLLRDPTAYAQGFERPTMVLRLQSQAERP